MLEISFKIRKRLWDIVFQERNILKIFLLKYKTSIYKMPGFDIFFFLFHSGQVTITKISYWEYSTIEKIQSVILEAAISWGKDWLFGDEEMTVQSLTFVYNFRGKKRQQTTGWKTSNLTIVALYSVPL